MAKVIIFIGGISALPNSGRPTGMFKQQVSGPLELGPEGFIGDQQADRRVHGGPEKAVHLYPASHYAKLAARFPEAAAQLIPGSLGENLSSADLDESSVRIGDIYRLGNARLQVCQPRNPCWKIDDRFDADGMAAYIAEQSLTGWYWRVVQPGQLDADDALELEQSTSTAPTLAAAMALWQVHRPAVSELEQLAATPGIASNWQRKILDRADWLRQQPGQALPPQPPFHVKPDAP
jgi:MOSC domain-containing protein YiiM